MADLSKGVKYASGGKANVNPKNKKSLDFFKKNGFKLIQYTYELTLD